MPANDNTHPIGQWLYEQREDGLYRRRIGFKPVWERRLPAAPPDQQALIPGVAPVTDGDRARHGTQLPLQPSCAQRPADDGLFDLGARGQHQML